jgi:coiled-coil domain-containing protein 12
LHAIHQKPPEFHGGDEVRAVGRAPGFHPLTVPTRFPRARARSGAEPVLRFRNHKPVSEALQQVVVQVEKATVPSVEEQVETADVVHNDATQEPLLNLAPKRPNWDLKRDLEPQMKQLRGATDRAILRLIAARVSAEQQQGDSANEQVDLAAAVERQQATEQDDAD